MEILLNGVKPLNILACMCKVACSCVRFDVSPAKRAFYAACNAIFLHSSGVNEIALLHLQETYSFSVLMYATPALNLTNRQVSKLRLLEQRYT